jgi:CHASE2 domain-containing sensor protein
MRRIFFGFGIYALAFCLPFLLENAAELSEYLPQSVKDKLETVGSAYQRWTDGPRTSEARYTAIVTLNEIDFPVLDEACKQRATVANLIPLLLQAGAGEVVIDLAFTRNICPESDDPMATCALQRELWNAAKRVPVIVGQASRKLEELDEKEADRGPGRGIGENGLLLRPVIDLPLNNPDYQISVGLIRLNQDFRRIPLSWSGYEEQGNGTLSKAGMQPTLAFAAAKSYRAAFPGGTSNLDRLNAEGRHPMTSLLPMSKLIQVEASELMCRGKDTRVLTSCKGGVPAEVRRKLNGKIVLLGWEDNREDVYTTPAGRLPGVFLQANFIESLLDSRYLRVPSTWWQIALSLVWFAFIELAFLIYRDETEKALAGAVVVFVAGAFLFYYIAVVNLGFYLALLPPSFVAVLLRCWYQWSEHKQGENNKHEPHTKHGVLSDAGPVDATPASTGQARR